jgi:hypothetical protein
LIRLRDLSSCTSLFLSKIKKKIVIIKLKRAGGLRFFQMSNGFMNVH